MLQKKKKTQKKPNQKRSLNDSEVVTAEVIGMKTAHTVAQSANLFQNLQQERQQKHRL